jgi:hypothetical protein
MVTAAIKPENSGKIHKEAIAPDMITKFWLKFFDSNPADIARHGDAAIKWFRIQVAKSMHLKADTIINAPEQYKHGAAKASKGLLGKLYLFKYKAENAGDMETGLYDAYPMVFFFNLTKTKEGKSVLWGLNMHYLAPKERGILYRELMKMKSTKGWTPNTKLKAQWGLIKTVCSSGLAEHAVHAYRIDRIQSRMIEIPASDWIVAVFLQIGKFIKAEDHKTGMSQSDDRKSIIKKSHIKNSLKKGYRT